MLDSGGVERAVIGVVVKLGVHADLPAFFDIHLVDHLCVFVWNVADFGCILNVHLVLVDEPQQPASLLVGNVLVLFPVVELPLELGRPNRPLSRPHRWFLLLSSRSFGHAKLMSIKLN